MSTRIKPVSFQPPKSYIIESLWDDCKLHIHLINAVKNRIKACFKIPIQTIQDHSAPIPYYTLDISILLHIFATLSAHILQRTLHSYIKVYPAVLLPEGIG